MANRANRRLAQHAQSVEQALRLHRQGQLKAAEQIYGAVLAADARHFDALHLCGVLKHQQGRSVDALRLVAAALKEKPSAADALLNYGVILEALKRHEEALASFNKVLRVRPGDVLALYNRGNVLKAVNRHADALASFDAALALAPDHADAHYARGNVLRCLGRLDDAMASYDRALSLTPGRPDILANRGATLLELDRVDEALEGLDKALAGDPNSVVALNNRGNALIRRKRYHDALASYDKALALCPDDADAVNNKGLALAALGQYDLALAHFADALRIAPHFVDAHISRGNSLVALNRMDEALRSYSEAIALSPEHPEANFNDALTRLCTGDFREGWRKYEYRWQRKQNAAQRLSFAKPVWRGEKDLQGKVILLAAEQGLGDAIQFVRYAPLVAALGAQVLVGVHRPLTELMATVPGVSRAIGDGGALPDFDLYCPLPSLPLAFATELATIPADVPYIRPCETRIAKWRARLAPSERLRVGICWAGNSAHVNDQARSMPLARFAALLAVPGVDFVSLQKEVGASEAAILSRHGVVQLGQEFADFADTAAVIAMLDLVISVDTSVAHLAGAMAKAVGVLVPFAPDFRWLLDRTDSPWYPTMRLFRQPAIGDWESPLERLCQELIGVARSTLRAAMSGAVTARG